ncbi:MAG: hypothetical protein WCX20_01630 [Candidatus Shapirobacteria bacterium]|jgi:hypothetical protein
MEKMNVYEEMEKRAKARELENWTEENKEAIRSIQPILYKIQNKIPVFFNITKFQEWGLVYGRDQYFINAYGNKERLKTNWYLTELGKAALNLIF